jgi:hypothetical protein
MICHWCGVKVTSTVARRERFGHIELVPEIPHPLGRGADLLAAFPVLPAAYVASHAGEPLAALYEELVERTLASIVNRLVEIILPAVQLASEWNLAEGTMLARGLALEPREGDA